MNLFYWLLQCFKLSRASILNYKIHLSVLSKISDKVEKYHRYQLSKYPDKFSTPFIFYCFSEKKNAQFETPVKKVKISIFVEHVSF